MDYKNIYELINSIKMDHVQIEFPNGVKVTMSNKPIPTDNSQGVVVSQQFTSKDPVKTSIEEISLQGVKTSEPAKGFKTEKIVTSPIVGTFYEASSPNAKAFVEVGTSVKKGQVLCIVEAMKLMNEIVSEYDGVIAEILVKNEQLVEYGQPMFVIA